METFWQVTIGVLGALGGTAGIFTAIAYYRKIGRKYDVENDSTEIKNLKEIIDVLQTSKDNLEKRVQALEEALGLKNSEIVSLESECTRRERAMNCQSLCETKPTKCPIIVKYKYLTENGQADIRISEKSKYS